MFNLNEKFEVDSRILKFDYIRYSPVETSPINTPNSQLYIIIAREDSVFLMNSYRELNFDVIKRTDNSRFANDIDIRLVNLGPIALVKNLQLPTNSGKHLEDISHAHIVSLMYKLITSKKGSDDLTIGFDRDRNTRRDELTENKNAKGRYHLRIMLKDLFGFAEHHAKATYALGYKLTLTRIKMMLL